MPPSGTWQVEQERPFVPRDWKKGFDGSCSGPPLMLTVRECPNRFGTRASLAGAPAMLDATTLDGLESASLLAW
jgi:hypothetical protein